MAEPFRLLTQGEIDVLRHLARYGGHRSPVTLGARMRAHVPALWRMGLIDVWFRRVPYDEPGPPGAYFSLSLAGLQRAQPFLSSRRAGRACDPARTSSVHAYRNQPK